MPRIAILLAVVSACAACSGAATATSAREWPAWLPECSLGLESPVRCGAIDVLESPDTPGGRRLQIRVVVVPARDGSPLPDPVLFLAGGPGQGAADLVRGLAPMTAFLGDARDRVFIDQRGTGGSNPLACAQAPRTQDLFGRLFDPVRLTACRDELAARAALTRYTTDAAAADIERAIEALGYQHVNLWGGSYGTRMALVLARRMPDRVRTLTLEGVVPTFFTWPTHAASDANLALDAVVADCVADAECARAYPGFRRDVDAAFARLAARPATATVRDPLSRQIEVVTFTTFDLAYSVRGLLYGTQVSSLPRLFREAAEGGFDGFAQAYVTRARTLELDLARGVHLSVYCAEDLPFVDLERTAELSTGTILADSLLSEYRRACDIWPRASISPTYREPVALAVPALLLTGRRDPVTPPRTAEDAARTLTRSRVLVWRYGGHSSNGLADPACRQAIISSFVTAADPDRLAVDCMTTTTIQPFHDR